jgi:hypothetical protein
MVKAPPRPITGMTNDRPSTSRPMPATVDGRRIGSAVPPPGHGWKPELRLKSLPWMGISFLTWTDVPRVRGAVKGSGVHAAGSRRAGATKWRGERDTKGGVTGPAGQQRGRTWRRLPRQPPVGDPVRPCRVVAEGVTAPLRVLGQVAGAARPLPAAHHSAHPAARAPVISAAARVVPPTRWPSARCHRRR